VLRRAPSVLFVHDNFPGQFGALSRWLAGRGWQVTFATAAQAPAVEGIRILRYTPHRAPSPQTHPYAQPMDRAAINAQAFARAAFAARRDGLCPDVIVAHSGWGAGMFARQVFPRARFVAYCEWWYRFPGADVAWLAANGYPLAASPEAPLHEHARNAPIAMDLADADAAVCPTAFQASQFPRVFRDRLTVLHDGIDTSFFRPDPAARRDTLAGLVPEGARVLTYATRGMEPHRGFPQFMAALPEILASAPDTIVVVAGENRVCYGGEAFRRIDWKARALAENDIDPARIRFTGRLESAAYLRLLQRSDAHVYLTVPFVLSWSMLEAMSAGCAMVVSDTAPVREFADADAAVMADLASPDALSAGVMASLSEPVSARRARARCVVEERAPKTDALRRWQALVEG
jgi:glycosyltransferase involved in cell wall biosynthesis